MKPIYKSLVLGVLAQALFTASLAVAADINERTIKLGYGTPAEHPIGQGVNTFAELVGQKSGGKLKVRAYPASALGSDTQMISGTQGGVQEVVAVSSAPLLGMVKQQN